jgi:hypothetical protein
MIIQHHSTDSPSIPPKPCNTQPLLFNLPETTPDRTNIQLSPQRGTLCPLIGIISKTGLDCIELGETGGLNSFVDVGRAAFDL